MALARRLTTLLVIATLTNAADDTSITPHHDCGGLRGDGSCAATTTSVCKGVQNFASAAGRVRRCSKIEGDLLIDHVSSLYLLTEVTGSITSAPNQYDGGNLHTLRREQPWPGRRDSRPPLTRSSSSSMTAFGTLERGGWAALQRLDASALCASELVAQDEAPCYCGDAADDCFEHPDVIRELTKYVDEDDDDDEDDVEAIAPAPRQAPPAGWGKLLSA